ncbi:hypothetical protein FMEAI12_6460007 [Parafrankia sp. Ea1.12]|nr:hypothetical protein FMEAI12_6460007 [Parafrankia sp. Ea1.12]
MTLMEFTMAHRQFLVVGGTGKTGRQVVARLRARGAPVRVASRSAQRRFDWTDERTWQPALNGVAGVYVAAPDEVTAVPAFLARAADTGVERLVLLSARGVDQPGYYGDDYDGAGGAPAQRGRRPVDRNALDDSAARLVRAELQRGLLSRLDPAGRAAACGWRRRGSLRRHARHRRCRGRGAHRGQSCRSDVRAVRSACPDIQRGSRRDRTCLRTRHPVRRHSARPVRRGALRTGVEPGGRPPLDCCAHPHRHGSGSGRRRRGATRARPGANRLHRLHAKRDRRVDIEDRLLSGFRAPSRLEVTPCKRPIYLS